MQKIHHTLLQRNGKENHELMRSSSGEPKEYTKLTNASHLKNKKKVIELTNSSHPKRTKSGQWAENSQPKEPKQGTELTNTSHPKRTKKNP